MVTSAKFYAKTPHSKNSKIRIRKKILKIRNFLLVLSKNLFVHIARIFYLFFLLDFRILIFSKKLLGLVSHFKTRISLQYWAAEIIICL